MKIKWDEFEGCTNELFEKIKADNYAPEIIVAIGVSGLIPAAMLAKKFNLKNIEILTLASYDKNNQRSKPIIVSSSITPFITGKRVLCVDDIVATGDTFDCARSEILALRPQDLRFAAPVVSERVCKKYPDYYGKSIMRSPDDFISLPWDA